MDTQKSDLLQGTLDVLILKIVALEPIHGYGIAQRIRQISKAVLQVQQGSLYPALHRLERAKWITAEWKKSENQQNLKVYRLTAAGKKQLLSERSRWEQLVHAIGGILGHEQS